MLVCVYFYHCTRDRGCSAHPAFPAPSFLRDNDTQTSGASRRENADVYLVGGLLSYFPRFRARSFASPRNGDETHQIAANNKAFAIRGAFAIYFVHWQKRDLAWIAFALSAAAS